MWEVEGINLRKCSRQVNPILSSDLKSLMQTCAFGVAHFLSPD